jgi:energy-coupling factor transporter ATP-binding protein EcfA2
MILNPGQQSALDCILASYKPGARHLLTGYAGSGKTTLMQRAAEEFGRRGISVILTAPTHKAVAVLAAKTSTPCITIHALLSLKPKVKTDRLEFVRRRDASPVETDVVVIDECSMLAADLMAHIRRHLPNSFVIFVGDPAQLPPVGETKSLSFDTKKCSHLNEIVRQGAGNPVLDAAHTIRASQGGAMNWDWVRSVKAPPLGVFLPGRSVDTWLQKAFTSPEFENDPDRFRYLCWTNQRVAEVNRRVRRHRYGENIGLPFMVGERALIRSPVVVANSIIFNTNEEAIVQDIQQATFNHKFARQPGAEAWDAEIPTWAVTLKKSDGFIHTVHTARGDEKYNQVINRIKDEAQDASGRWNDLHEFKGNIANLHSIYALTVHNSQGSTFSNAFVDVADIKRRVPSNTLEAQQLFYVAATRPSTALILVNT